MEFHLNSNMFCCTSLIPLFVTMNYKVEKAYSSVCPLRTQKHVGVVDRALELHTRENPAHFHNLIIGSDVASLVW